MAATREDIRGWLNYAKSKNATHMIVVCDTFEWEDYPVEVYPDQIVADVVKKYSDNMQKVMEVYNMSLDLESQLSETRAYHL